MSAPGTYGMEHAVNALIFVRRKHPLVEGPSNLYRVLKRTATHVTFRMVEPDGSESTLPVRTFDGDFETAPVPQIRPVDPIPVSAAQAIADAYGWDQVVIIARRIGSDPEPHGEHVTTFGQGEDHRIVAAQLGAFFRARVMEWIENPSVDPLVEAMAERDLERMKVARLEEGFSVIMAAVAEVIEAEADFRAHLQIKDHSDPLTDAIADLAVACVDVVSPSSSAGAP